MKAIFTHNNAYDTILLANGTAMMVDAETFKDFINIPELSVWDGDQDWTEHGEDIMLAASAYGKIVACYDDKDKFVIFDDNLLQDRNFFYLGDSPLKKS